MEDNTKKTNGSSRREVLKLGALGLGAVGAIGIASGAQAQGQVAKKAQQKAVMYQLTPKGDKQCSNCQQFQAPSSCRLVDGEISPNGYCILWAKKPA